MSPKDNEREFRQMLSQKISGSSIGLWLLVPELIRLGAWDVLKGWTGGTDTGLDPRIALQVVNEAALCVNRIRKKNSLGHQGFQLANGMSRLVTDEQVHLLLNKHTTEQVGQMMVNLGHQRQLSGHYKGGLIAIDPHRIVSSSKRIMAKKKKKPDSPSAKMLQTFFSVCCETGQPIMATMSSTGIPTTMASKKLLSATSNIIREKSLLLADKEHFTCGLLNEVREHEYFEILTPALRNAKMKAFVSGLEYKPLWAGYAIAESEFTFEAGKKPFRLITQRTGEIEKDYNYTPFITTSTNKAVELLTNDYDRRWGIEEFFRFENNMGLNRTSTHNLNIRYGKLALSMIAQAATYQLRQKLDLEYKKWEASHLANEILAWADGDIKVEADTIIVTFYGAPKHLNPKDYVGLPKILKKENIDPRIPWLYDFKLDFRFK